MFYTSDGFLLGSGGIRNVFAKFTTLTIIHPPLLFFFFSLMFADRQNYPFLKNFLSGINQENTLFVQTYIHFVYLFNSQRLLFF